MNSASDLSAVRLPAVNFSEALLAAGADESSAIFSGEEVVTYRRLRTEVRRVVSVLSASGGPPGDRIGIWSENSPFFVAAYLGVLRAGRVAVPFQTEQHEETFARIVRDCGMKLLLVSARHAGRLAPWAERAGVRLLQGGDVLAAAPDATDRSPPPCDPQRDLAAIMFTSGSTGEPKGVMVTHGNLLANTADILSYMRLTAADRSLVVLPFHYCFGASVLHTHLAAGGSVVLNNSFLYPETVLRDLAEKECTGLAGTPSTFQILMRRTNFCETRFPDLRWFQQAGGKLPEPFLREIMSAFPDKRFYVMYGQTEATARLSYLPPERLADKLGSVGRGLPSTRLAVLRADGSPVQPGSGETGEIVATGPGISPGYWNDPVETRRYFRADGLHTGDLARVDQDGFIYIVQRERDFIKTGGNRVAAGEVEEVIAELPAIVEVAVVGSPDPLLGEAVEAFVVPRAEGAVDPESVLSHCMQKLARFKVPKRVRLLKNMPRGGSGKILKAELRRMAGGL
jgi:acyl-CoA synthetase (AMP-forming)/AMP-acid ligase II